MRYPITQRPATELFPLLAEIPDAPSSLFIRGVIPKKTTFITVIGARKHTHYGKTACLSLIHGLRDCNITIISGLAFGIDSVAHRAALEYNIPTIAIPGSGLADDTIYPRNHLRLAHRILESGGALVSEYPPNTPAAPYRFPARNRIMAGISPLTIIIEAKQKSGSLITARLALDYNRDVGAVPGPITHDTSVGTNQLIKDGAIPVTSAKDVMEILNINPLPKKKEKNKLLHALTEIEEKIFSLIKDEETINTLSEKSGIPTHQCTAAIISLTIKGLITERNGVIERSFKN